MSKFSVPAQLRYTAEHEWASHDGSLVLTVGITDYAQDALGDITYVELPAVGRVLGAHETGSSKASKPTLTSTHRWLVKCWKSTKPSLPTRPSSTLAPMTPG